MNKILLDVGNTREKTISQLFFEKCEKCVAISAKILIFFIVEKCNFASKFEKGYG